MQQRALAVLARVEEQELERRNLDLRAIEAELMQCRMALATARRSLGTELAAGWGLPGGPSLGSAFLAGLHDRLDRLARRQGDLAEARERAHAAVREALRACKALKTAKEELGRRSAEQAERQREAAREEAALLRRHGAAGPGCRPSSELGCEGDA